MRLPLIVSSLVLVFGMPAPAAFATPVLADSPGWKITAADLESHVDDFLRKTRRTLTEATEDELAALHEKVLEEMIAKNLLLAQATDSMRDAATQQAGAMLAQVRARFSSQEVFEQELRSSGLSAEELRDRFRDRELITMVLDRDVPAGAAPGEEEKRRYYAEHSGIFEVPPKVRASRILVLTERRMSPEARAEKRRAIEQARERVLKGEDFAAVAREVSQDKFSASAGGDIGFFQKGANEASFDEMAFRLPVGEVSPVFETMVGYWFIKVTDTREATIAPYEEVEAQIAEHLVREKRQVEIDAHVAGLERSAKVVRHPLQQENSSPSMAAPASGKDPPM